MNDIINTKTKAARLNGSLVFIETIIELMRFGTINFQICIASSLQKKPTGQLQNVKQAINLLNPFISPDRNLWIETFQSETHNLLLNKYCVSLGHVILATKIFKSQFSTLNHEDFAASFLFLKNSDKNHVCFYNCGSNSGASILHKHIQIIPINGELPIMKLINERKIETELCFPFINRFSVIKSIEPEYIESTFISLLKECLDQTRLENYMNFSKEIMFAETQPDKFLSYNVLFTTEWMLVVPRSNEKYGISVNSLGFIGMLLVKSFEEMQFIKDAGGGMKILTEVSFPRL
jgi:ATP adenylyltransferase